MLKIDNDNFRRIHKTSWFSTIFLFIFSAIYGEIFILGIILISMFTIMFIISCLLVLYGMWNDYTFFEEGIFY